ncbi:YggS family pyridoxal phosphate-dependent enzyme [Desulfotomaculum defluvii]
MSIANNLSVIKEEIIASALKVGRDPAEISLIAVTKNVSAAKAKECVAAGVLNLGENRVQELQNKFPEVHGARWHLIGHLQTNKVKYIMGQVALVHSLDSWTLAEEIDKKSLAAGIVTPVLVQVNVAGEETKFGLAPREVRDFVSDAAALSGVVIQGLMTIAPFVDNPEEVRPVFRQLKELANGLRDIPGVSMEHLSMGMTNDYKVAIEEGATLVRIGTAIFGSRY